MDTITLRYAVSIEDVIAFNQYILKRAVMRFVLPYVLPLVVVGCVLGFISADATTNMRVLIFTDAITICSICGVIASLFYPRVLAIIFSLIILVWIATAIYSGVFLGALVFLPSFIFSGFTGLIIQKLYRYFYSGKNDSIGDRVVEINGDGVREKTGDLDCNYRWKLVTGIVRDGACIYIMLGRLKAIQVPKTAFTSGAAFDNFDTSVRDVFGRHSNNH